MTTSRYDEEATWENSVTSSALNETSEVWNSDDVKFERFASIVFSWTGCLLTSYVVAALSAHAVKKRLCFCSRAPRVGGASQGSKRDAAILHNFTILTALSVLVYMIIEVPLFWQVKAPFCTIYHEVKIICTAVGLFTVYFTLWYRVYTVFYLNPLLRKSTSSLTRTLNKLTVVLLFGMTAANMATFLTSPLYETTPIGCVKVQKTKDAKLKWGLLVSTTLLFQGLLLFSLLYPLCLHQRKLEERGMQGRSIMPLVKRAAITAGVCMASDATNAIYALTNKQKVVYTRHIVYGANMLVNLLALLLSFADWRTKLFPLCVDDTNVQKRASVVTMKTRSQRQSVV